MSASPQSGSSRAPPTLSRLDRKEREYPCNPVSSGMDTIGILNRKLHFLVERAEVQMGMSVTIWHLNEDEFNHGLDYLESRLEAAQGEEEWGK